MIAIINQKKKNLYLNAKNQVTFYFSLLKIL